MTDDTLLTKVLLEWSWRCEKGYPDLTNPKDLKILEEMFGIKLDEEKPKNSTEKDVILKILKLAGVEDELAQTVAENPLFRKAKNIEDFAANLQQYVKAFQNFYNYSKGALGPGELIPFLSIEGSRLGGSNEKDITDRGGKVLEVKEISVDKGAGEFRTASSGKTIGSTFLENYNSFKQGLLPFYQEDLYRDKLEKLFLSTSAHSLGKGHLKYLEDLVKDFPLDKNALSDDFEIVSFRGKSYAISKGSSLNFKLDAEGNLIEEPAEAEATKVALQKILKHPWVTGQTSPYKDLEELRQKALEGIDYFLFFKKDDPIGFARVVKRKDFDSIRVGRITLGALNLQYVYND